MKIKTILLLFTLLPLFAVAETSYLPAEFPGGEKAKRKFLKKNTDYPEYCLMKHIMGSVLVKYHIRPDGIIDKAEVIEPVFPLLDEEAVRLVYSMPKFEPAFEDGKAVEAWDSIGITFGKEPVTLVWTMLLPIPIEEGQFGLNNIRAGVKWSRQGDVGLALRNFKDALGMMPARFDVIDYCDSITEGDKRQYGFYEWVTKLLQKEADLTPATGPYYLPKIIELRKKALAKRPDDLAMLSGLHKAYILNGEYKNTIETGDKLLSVIDSLDEYERSRVYARQGKAKLMTGDFVGAVEMLGGDKMTLFEKYSEEKFPNPSIFEYTPPKVERPRYEPLYDLAEAYALLGRDDEVRQVIAVLKNKLKKRFDKNTKLLWSKKPGMLALARLVK